MDKVKLELSREMWDGMCPDRKADISARYEVKIGKAFASDDLDTPIELAPVPRFVHAGRVVQYAGTVSLEPIAFPPREVSRVTKAFCALADFERNNEMLVKWLICAAMGVALLVSAIVERT